MSSFRKVDMQKDVFRVGELFHTFKSKREERTMTTSVPIYCSHPDKSTWESITIHS